MDNGQNQKRDTKKSIRITLAPSLAIRTISSIVNQYWNHFKMWFDLAFASSIDTSPKDALIWSGSNYPPVSIVSREAVPPTGRSIAISTIVARSPVSHSLTALNFPRRDEGGFNAS